MIAIATGGRDYPPFKPFKEIYFLESVRRETGFDKLYHGAARGVDTQVGLWARRRGLYVREFPVTDEDWETLGRKAGILRNNTMLREAILTNEDIICIAFPGGKGTKYMVDRCKRYNFPIYEYVGQVLSR